MYKIILSFSKIIDEHKCIYGQRRLLLDFIPSNGLALTHDFDLENYPGDVLIKVIVGQIKYYNIVNQVFKIDCEIFKPKLYSWEEFIEEALKPSGWNIGIQDETSEETFQKTVVIFSSEKIGYEINKKRRGLGGIFRSKKISY